MKWCLVSGGVIGAEPSILVHSQFLGVHVLGARPIILPRMDTVGHSMCRAPPLPRVAEPRPPPRRWTRPPRCPRVSSCPLPLSCPAAATAIAAAAIAFTAATTTAITVATATTTTTTAVTSTEPRAPPRRNRRSSLPSHPPLWPLVATAIATTISAHPAAASAPAASTPAPPLRRLPHPQRTLVAPRMCSIVTLAVETDERSAPDVLRILLRQPRRVDVPPLAAARHPLPCRRVPARTQRRSIRVQSFTFAHNIVFHAIGPGG